MPPPGWLLTVMAPSWLSMMPCTTARLSLIHIWQNVRLAAKLLGWKIDIKSEEEKRQEVELQMSALVGSPSTPLENVPGLGEGLIEKLSAAGIGTVEALADMTPEQLEAIEGIGPKTVEKISLAVNNYFSSLEAGPVAEEATGEADAPVAATAETEAAPAEESATAAEEAVEESVEGETLVEARSADEPAGEPAAEVDETGEQAGQDSAPSGDKDKE